MRLIRIPLAARYCSSLLGLAMCIGLSTPAHAVWNSEDGSLEVRGFVDWLRGFNAGKPMAQRAAFHGLDLYSLYDSIRVVLKYLDERDPQTAAVERQRYGCLTPWQSDPATYGHAALTGTYGNCEPAVTAVLTDLMKRRNAYAERDGERFLDAMQNATLAQ